jgi:YgiT-type zinc finger domain-containing protein
MKKCSSPFTINRKGYHLILNSIPAWVCTQCEEPYFEASEVDFIQQIIRSVDKKTEKLALSAA